MNDFRFFFHMFLLLLLLLLSAVIWLAGNSDCGFKRVISLITEIFLADNVIQTVFNVFLFFFRFCYLVITRKHSISDCFVRYHGIQGDLNPKLISFRFVSEDRKVFDRIVKYRKGKGNEIIIT